MPSWFRSRTVWIVPLVLLVVALLEEVLTYKVRQHVHDVYQRAAIILILNAFAFGFAAGFLGPKLRDVFSRVRKGSKRTIGAPGVWAFYLAGYGAMYYAFL